MRARWRVWTTRRFCRECGRRFRRVRLGEALVLACALFGPGFLLGRLMRPPPPPLVLESGATRLAPLAVDEAGGAGEVRGGEPSKPEQAKPEPAYGPDGTAGERPTDPAEVVYVCGARTKKGTPCQRRVRGPGRCWQHRGMNAILPPSKLVVPG